MTSDGQQQEPARRARPWWVRRLLFPLVLVALAAGLLELCGWVLLTAAFPQYEAVRQTLLGGRGEQLVHRQSVVGQPYLLYTPAPNHTRRGHNAHGYRGTLVPRKKAPDTLRVVCLGGSTTYGSGVADAAKTYPAQLQRVLSQSPLPARIQHVEVVNAGIVSGTTAELLTHFLFKWRYYQPDVVVIHTGGNDGLAMLEPHYHPDYSHCRQALPTLRPLSRGSRWLLRSRLLAVVAIHLAYGDVLRGGQFTRHGTSPAAPWYGTAEWPQVADGETAFARNLATLVRETAAAGATPLLVPFRPNPHGTCYRPELMQAFARTERILLRLAQEQGVAVAPFPAEVISAANWVDGCHVGDAGSLEKARHIAEHLLPLVDGGKNK
ncbi:hypothetical protein HQ576_11415 [bacterium]|nr:hypothetical protein [bacterium]